MTLTRGFVPTKSLETRAHFDWYAATLPDVVEGATAIDHLVIALSAGEVVMRSGRHGFGVRHELMAGRRCIASVSVGGSQSRPFVESSGGDAPRAAAAVRAMWPDHQVPRLDSALDFDEEGCWDKLVKTALDVGMASGISSRVAGDWIGKKGGRTLYLGGRSSQVQVRVYEKGKQLPEFGRPNWVRVEVQVTPSKRAAKAHLARVTPLEAWGAGRWSGRLLEGLLGLSVEPLILTSWVRPDDERAREALVRQYGATINRLAVELGSWDAVGPWLRDSISPSMGVEEVA